MMFTTRSLDRSTRAVHKLLVCFLCKQTQVSVSSE
jgi:hypothetical protein